MRLPTVSKRIFYLVHRKAPSVGTRSRSLRCCPLEQPPTGCQPLHMAAPEQISQLEDWAKGCETLSVVAPGNTPEEVVVRIHLSIERETKNTVRFAEDQGGQPEGHPGADVVGTLYVQKFAWVAMGKPEHLEVQIAPAASTAS